MSLFELPAVMLAPNGARLTKADHPAVPMTLEDIVDCARACFAAGASGIHAHIRDEQGRHLLDAGRYRELQQALAEQVPGLRVQVTSEAAGRYQAPEQQAIIRALCPPYVSVGLREMLMERTAADLWQAQDFYHWAAAEQVTIQHIVYSAQDLQDWLAYVDTDLIPAVDRPHLLFVLGRYAHNLQSSPADLVPFLDVLRAVGDGLDWAVCAFGVAETACLQEAVRQGGKIRVGFENSLWHADGRVAADNRERVQAVLAALGRAELPSE